MIPDDFSVVIADWADDADREACRAVREQVFIVEQHVEDKDEWDEFDERSRHVLVRDAAGNPIGTGRLVPPSEEREGHPATPASIGRMAVLHDWRRREVGATIMNTLLEQARALAYPLLEMHAQTHAVPFYEHFGFVRDGEEYEECQIPHVNMRLELAPAEAPERPAPPERPEVHTVQIEFREQAARETLALIAAAKHSVYIYTRDLDPLLFDTEAALDALKRVGLSGRGAGVRIIIQDPQQPLRRGHRLIALAQRLTSVFSLRTPTQPEDLQYASAFVLNDTYGFYFRTLGTRFEGEVVNYAPGRHAQLLEYFKQVWERSETSEELRQLAL